MEGIGKAAVAEFIATFALIFIGAGAVVMTGISDGGLVGIALAHGLTLAIMVSIIGHISGGMVNPAVTIGLWVTGKLETTRAAVYIVAECLGGIAGALTLKLVVPAAISTNPPKTDSSHSCGCSGPKPEECHCKHEGTAEAPATNAQPNSRPDFSKMTRAEKLAWNKAERDRIFGQ